MGSEKVTTETKTQQQATPTAEETRLNQIRLGQVEAADPQQREVNELALRNISTLLAGGELPGNLAKLSRGIDANVVSEISQEAIADVEPGLQKGGIFDSGTRASVQGRIAGDIRRGAEEFNIGSLFNLLNLGVGGQAQVQQPILATAGSLSSSLAGLRSINSTGSSVVTDNPFQRSFKTAAGTSLAKTFTGGRSFGYGPFSIGGT